MHKNKIQNAENSIEETLFFKIPRGNTPPDFPRGSPPEGASRANSVRFPSKKNS